MPEYDPTSLAGFTKPVKLVASPTNVTEVVIPAILTSPITCSLDVG